MTADDRDETQGLNSNLSLIPGKVPMMTLNLHPASLVVPRSTQGWSVKPFRDRQVRQGKGEPGHM
jgi:hypothetical protein